MIYTGGTVGMRHITPELHPHEPSMLSPDELETALRRRCDLDVEYDFRPLLGREDFEPLVSSQILPEHWRLIARTIQQHYEQYDGFVVLHGTDTMAWTASALSFMFTNLSKPIVLTGSQRPLSATPSDAVSNFTNSVMLAGRGHESIPVVPEVVICFGDLVLRGNRTTKVSAASLQGFDTPNHPHLGRVGRRFEVDSESLRPLPARPDGCFVRLGLEPRVADVIMYPGLQATQLAALLDGSHGAVLRTFGGGNAPGGRDVEAVVREAVDRGAVLVNVTQSNEGTVEAGMLTGSRALTDCGVVSGLDLTGEAALTKLMVLLGNETRDAVGQQMQLDQRGEQSLDLVELRARSSGTDAEGVSRVVLTPSLHARVQPDRLASAVLRLRARQPAERAVRGELVAHLNHWGAGPGTGQDIRRLDTPGFVHEPAPGGTPDVVVDVTGVARHVLEPGAPVTLTLVRSGSDLDVEAVLTLFLERRPASADR